MNQWIFPMAFVALVVVVGAFAVANAQSDAAPSTTEVAQPSCGSASCTGGCTASNNCGLSTCGATSGGSCGCGR